MMLPSQSKTTGPAVIRFHRSPSISRLYSAIRAIFRLRLVGTSCPRASSAISQVHFSWAVTVYLGKTFFLAGMSFLSICVISLCLIVFVGLHNQRLVGVFLQ